MRVLPAIGATATHKYSAPTETCGRVMVGGPPLSPRRVTLVVTDAAAQGVPTVTNLRICSGELNPDFRRP